MGVKYLNALIRKLAPDSIKKIHLSMLEGQKLGVDLQLYLHKFQIQDKDAIYELYKQIIHLKKYKIDLVYVLDGKPPAEKLPELYRRLDRRNKSKEVIEYLSNNQEIDNIEIRQKLVELKKNSVGVSYELKMRAKYLCQIMNVEFIDYLEMEADKAIGLLYKSNKINGVLSEDNDMLVYGCEYLYRGHNVCKDTLTQISLSSIFKELNIDYNKFVDICILSGCDYYKNINYNIDNVKTSFIAYYLIKKYGNIETLDSKNMIPLDLDYNKIRQIYID